MSETGYSGSLPARLDPVTGARVVQLTSGPANCHHLYPSRPPGTHDGRLFVFISHETGTPNLCAIEPGTGEIYRLTYRKDLNPFSCTVTRDNQAVLFTAGEGLWAVTIPEGEETLLTSFAGSRIPNTAVSPDGRTAAVALRSGARGRVVEVDMVNCTARDVVDRAGPVGALRYSPDGARILYQGGPDDRVRVVGRDGAGDGLAVPQGAGEWMAGGDWLGTDSLLFVKFHDGLYSSSPGSEAKALFKGPAWHACARADARLVVFDTHSPDIGVVLLAPGTGKWRTLCYPRSSNRGSRWPDPLPQGDETMEATTMSGEAAAAAAETEYGPEWTHPHPVFTTDGRGVVFTSDYSGVARVYVAEIPVEWEAELCR